MSWTSAEIIEALSGRAKSFGLDVLSSGHDDARAWIYVSPPAQEIAHVIATQSRPFARVDIGFDEDARTDRFDPSLPAVVKSRIWIGCKLINMELEQNGFSNWVPGSLKQSQQKVG